VRSHIDFLYRAFLKTARVKTYPKSLVNTTFDTAISQQTIRRHSGMLELKIAFRREHSVSMSSKQSTETVTNSQHAGRPSLNAEKGLSK